MLNLFRLLLPAILITGTFSCRSHVVESTEAAPVQGTPVTGISVFLLSESIELNATSAFQLKSFTKASSNGYLQLVNAELGKFANSGQEVFAIYSKEAVALGNKTSDSYA